jgi:hypothetical protein
MREEFLQFVWEHHLFSKGELQTVDGRPIKILSAGRANYDSGPDFFNARVQIADTIWAGNIEVHHKSSQWFQHKHDTNPAYNNVILHVVELFDKPVVVNGEELPTFVMSYPTELFENFEQLLKSKKWIACEDKLPSVDPFILRFWYSSLMTERLQSKTQSILEILGQNTNNWNETFYQLIARNFGLKTNAIPFELLSRSISLQLLSKHKNSLFQIEALLFGQAGFLNETLLGDDYYLSLRNEYSFLYKKYNLAGIDAHLWKFLRLRPVNFPTIRIAQLAALINQSTALFSKILETNSLDEIQKLFDVTASEYWNTHYRFNKISSENKPKHLGDTVFQNLVINTIAPLFFVYGDLHSNQPLKDRALHFLEQLPSEQNQIIGKWSELKIVSQTAFESQALIQLKKQYCENKKCLHCQLGAKIITSVNQSNDESAIQ